MGKGNADRYRVLISDGVYCNSFAMLATQLNPMVENNQLAEFSVIRVNRHLTSLVNHQNNEGQKYELFKIMNYNNIYINKSNYYLF